MNQKNPLEEGMVTHSRILAWRISWTEELEGYSPQGRTESDVTEATACTRGTAGNGILRCNESSKSLNLFFFK